MTNKKKVTEATKPPRGLTEHGAKILAYMRAHKIKGNFRDHVLFVGEKLIDSSGEFTIRRDSHHSREFVALIHKANLHLVIGDSNAEKFWSKKLRRRNNGLAHSDGWRKPDDRAQATPED